MWSRGIAGEGAGVMDAFGVTGLLMISSCPLTGVFEHFLDLYVLHYYLYLVRAGGQVCWSPSGAWSLLSFVIVPVLQFGSGLGSWKSHGDEGGRA